MICSKSHQYSIGNMAPLTMKAALFKEYGAPVVIEDVPIPTPTGREVLVRVKAASLCHSDLTIIAGALGHAPLPFIVGHEAISVVEALGPDAAAYGLNVGDMVGAPLWHGMCLECSECRHHGPDFCPKRTMKGLTSPGFFAEYALVDAAGAVVIPREYEGLAVPLAPVFCAGITVWDALERARLRVGETVGIVGAGGLGGLAARFAQAMGVKVVALDIHDAQLEAFKADGSADEVVNTRGVAAEELIPKVASLNGGRLLDAVIVTTGALAGYHTAMSIVRTEGKVVAVGLPEADLAVRVAVLCNRAVSLIGSKVPGQASAQKCVDFCLRKKIFSNVYPRNFRLDDLNEMIQLMKEGQVHEGRMIVQFE
ncbi:chaperonin 10-like protein [Aspergillus egyptiacus]|nr:chaperonin 10-like protein [Aspergillus egyptiacus]